MSQSKKYPLTDPAAVAAKIVAEGGPAIDPTQPTGQASADGVTLSWGIDIVAKTITIVVLSKPWIIPYSTIWSHVDQVMS